jgi:TolC family type I secretion outer membrane protein
VNIIETFLIFIIDIHINRKEFEIMKYYFKIITLILIIQNILISSAQEKYFTVEECVQIALEKNPELIQGQFNLKITQKDLIIARSYFFPNLTTGLGYNHSAIGPSSKLRIDPNSGIPVPEQPFEIISWSSRASLQLSQALFRPIDFYNYKKSLSLKESAEYDLEYTKQNIIYIVKECYYNLLKAEKLLEVQDSTLISSEESFKNAEVRYKVGTAPKSDVLKARVQLETNKLGKIEAQNNIAIASASLNHVLGFDVDHPIKVVDNLEVAEIDINYSDAIKNSFKFHPSLLKGASDLIAAKQAIGASSSNFLPSVSAYYSYSWRHENFNQINNFFDTDYNWSAGINLSFPVFQGFSRIAEVGKAKLTHKLYEEAFSQIKRDVTLEVKQAYFEVQHVKKKITVTQNAEEASEEDLRLNKEKYKLGAGTMLDLINAQVSYTEAQSNRIQALYDYQVAVTRLLRAMGKLEK